MIKFNQSLPPELYNPLGAIATKRGITVSELIRNVVIPDWLKAQEKERK